jgi:hypothetical protein
MQKPGPQQYNCNNSTFDAKSCAIGKEKRNCLGTESFVPGPGAYEIKANSTLPQFSIPKSKSNWIKSSGNPGPGQYEPKPIFNAEYSNIGINKDNRRPFYD